MGGFLGDVTKTLGAVVSAEQGDLRDLSSILQGKPTIAEQRQTLWDQLTKAATTTPQGPGELSPQMQLARSQNDLPGFIKATGQQRSRSALLDSVIASGLPQTEQETLKRRIMAGDEPDKIWQDFNAAQNRLAMQTQKKEAVAEAKQTQLEKEQRAVQRKQEEKAAGTLEARLKARLKADPTLATDPERLTSIMFLEGVRKPEDAELAIKGLRATGDLPKETTALERVKNFFANLTKAPAAVQPPSSGVRQYDPKSKSLR